MIGVDDAKSTNRGIRFTEGNQQNHHSIEQRTLPVNLS